MTFTPHRPICLLTLTWVAVLFFMVPAQAGPITWMGHEEGLAAGKAANKKVFINFYADWCSWCKKLDKETFRDRAVEDYLKENFISVKVDSDRRQDLATAYGVQGLPTLWFVTEQGEPISALASFVPADTFITILRYIHTESYKRMTFADFAKAQRGKNQP